MDIKWERKLLAQSWFFSLSLTLAFIHTTNKLFPIFKLGGPEVIYTRRGVLCVCVKKIKRTRTPNRTRAITSIGIPLIYSYLFFFFLFLLHRNDGARVRGANELFRDLLLFFFFFSFSPSTSPTWHSAQIWLFYLFCSRESRALGMPGSAGYQTWREGDFFSFSERVDYANNKERKFWDIEKIEREKVTDTEKRYKGPRDPE